MSLERKLPLFEMSRSGTRSMVSILRRHSQFVGCHAASKKNGGPLKEKVSVISYPGTAGGFVCCGRIYGFDMG